MRGGDAGGLEEVVDAGFDGLELVGDPEFEVGAGDGAFDLHAACQPKLGEAEVGGFVAREIDFEALNGLMELVAEVFFNEGDESGDFFGLFGAGAGGFEDFGDVAGFEEGEVVPALEVGVDPGGGGGDEVGGAVGCLGEGALEGGGAQGWGDEMADDAGVEGVSGEAEAGVAEDALGARDGAAGGADVDEGEVAGSAAEVADEDEFVAAEGGLVGVGGGDGFELEGDGVEAGVEEGGFEAGEGEGVILVGFGADEADGAANGGVVDGLLEGKFGVEAEVGEDAGDEVFDGVATAEDFGSGEGAAGEVGLEGLDEAALGVGGEVVLDGGGAGEAFDLRATGLFALFEIEDGAGGLGGGGGGGEGDEFDVAAGEREGDGAVGGAEVDADGGLWMRHDFSGWAWVA